MSTLRCGLLFLLMIGLTGVPVFAKKPPKPRPCEELSVLNTKIIGASLYVVVENPAKMPVKGFIVGSVQVGGESFIFYSKVTVPKASVVTYELTFKDPINVLVWIKMSCDIPPEAASEGPDPILQPPTKPGGDD